MALVVQNLRHVGAVIGGCNFVGFCFTALLETHKITDLVGVGAFVGAAISLQSRVKGAPFGSENLRRTLINSAVILWGTRLSSFLFYRVLKLGEDKRLEKFFREPGEGFLNLKKAFFPLNLAGFWTIQAAWGFICMLPVTLINSVPGSKLGPLSILSSIGIFGGIAFEAVADWQKYKYKQENKDRWCDKGLWAWCRHPNYFGELTTWWSIFAFALPVLTPSQALLALASPSFISSLLLFVSGIPLLEKSNQKKYGNEPEFIEYRERTPLLFPLPPKEKTCDITEK